MAIITLVLGIGATSTVSSALRNEFGSRVVSGVSIPHIDSIKVSRSPGAKSRRPESVNT